MKIDEFIQENKKLERLYEKELTEEQTQEWYKALKNLTVMQYRYIVGEIYRNLSYFPKLAQVLEVVKDAKFNKPEENKNQEKVECKICGGKGFITYQKKVVDLNNTYLYVARCNCKNAEEYKAFPSAMELGLI